MKKLIVFAIAILGFTAVSFGQVTATATATGTIVTPISITKTIDMAFGNVATSGTAGTVVMTTAGVRSVTGGVTLPAVTGTFNAAAFNVGGFGSSTFTIGITTSVIATKTGGQTMLIDNFVTNPLSTGTLDVNGSKDVSVGATLNVGINQAPGLYTSAPFTVTVNYN